MKRYLSLSLVFLILFSVVASADTLYFDIKGHWAEENIIHLTEIGLVHGDGSGNFRPDDFVTFGEAIAMVNRACGIKADEIGNIPWYRANSDAAEKAELLYGLEPPSDTFLKKNAPRLYVFILLSNAMLNKGVTYNDVYLDGLYTDTQIDKAKTYLMAFNDVNDISEYNIDWLYVPVCNCSKEGLVLGDMENNLNINKDITRAEVAAIISRFLERVEKHEAESVNSAALSEVGN